MGKAIREKIVYGSNFLTRTYAATVIFVGPLSTFWLTQTSQSVLRGARHPAQTAKQSWSK
ncbi:MAG TPA: hypothetical protein VGU44_00240 [Gammaproteobacteria bacterium]|nr:hypothetical protein [Gammaproteobacteria bacterium]